MLERTAPDLIKNAYDQLLHSGISLSKIRDAVNGDRLFLSSDDPDVFAVVGRSILWKLFLLRQGPLKGQAGEVPESPLQAVKEARVRYRDLLVDKLRAPDGSLEDGFIIPGTTTPHKRNQDTTVNLETNNPLSLHEDNPWRQWFANVELRKTILQDVERTFPEIDYFRAPDKQRQLTDILFVYCNIHPDIGYRQGMHEVLAPIYYAVDYDSLSPDSILNDGSDVKDLCSRLWVSADAWALFDVVMQGLEKWYEWREPPASASTSSKTQNGYTSQQGPVEFRPYVAPIVHECDRIHSSYLRTVDPLLYQRMQSAGIEPQLYGIRWLRLAFTREFNLRDAMILWDCIFVSAARFATVPWICVSMLLRIRNDLIPSDYTGQLTSLLRYSPRPNSESVPLTSPMSLLFRQALELQLSPTPATGAAVVMENRNLLGIPVDIPEQSPQKSRPASSAARGRHTYSRFASEDNVEPGHSRQRSFQAQAAGLPEIFAKGLLERGESLGINKTLMSAVSELRRNLPDLTSGLRSPTISSDSFGSFPLIPDRHTEDRAVYETRSRFEVDQQLRQLKRGNQKLGDSITWILSVLQGAEPAASESQSDASHLDERRSKALHALGYVRDALLNPQSSELDDSQLFDSEELQRRESLRVDLPPELSASLSAPASVLHESSSRAAQASSGSTPSATTLPNSRWPPSIPPQAIHSSPASPTPSHLPSPSLSRLSSSQSPGINLRTKQVSVSSLRDSLPTSSKPSAAVRPSPFHGTGRRRSSNSSPSLHDPLGALR